MEIDSAKLKKEIIAGKIFIYPTDTIYGLGCDATNKEAVDRIKKIKGRDGEKPLSVIAPSFDWIEENCVVGDLDLNKYLPGPYTVILEKKNSEFLSHVASGKTIGVRMPDNNVCEEIQKSGVPFITTSVNLSGEPFAVRFSDIREEIIDSADIIIHAEDETELSGKPSTLIIGGKEIGRK